MADKTAQRGRPRQPLALWGITGTPATTNKRVRFTTDPSSRHNPAFLRDRDVEVSLSLRDIGKLLGAIPASELDGHDDILLALAKVRGWLNTKGST
jgi:hypothetical protein